MGSYVCRYEREAGRKEGGRERREDRSREKEGKRQRSGDHERSRRRSSPFSFISSPLCSYRCAWAHSSTWRFLILFSVHEPTKDAARDLQVLGRLVLLFIFWIVVVIFIVASFFFLLFVFSISFVFLFVSLGVVLPSKSIFLLFSVFFLSNRKIKWY